MCNASLVIRPPSNTGTDGIGGEILIHQHDGGIHTVTCAIIVHVNAHIAGIVDAIHVDVRVSSNARDGDLIEVHGIQESCGHHMNQHLKTDTRGAGFIRDGQ